MNNNSEKSKSFVKKWNIIPKAICLFFAFIIWIYVMEVDSPDYEETFEDVPVTLTGITELDGRSLSVFSGQDTLVDITVKGQKSVIAKNSVEDLSVTADVSKIDSAGSYTLNLDFDLPSGLTFSDASVRELKLFIDKRTSQNKALSINPYNYQVPSGYELGNIVCDTDTVTVTGAESVLNNVSYAQVDVNLTGNNMTESFTADGTIVLYDAADNIIENKYIKLSQNTAKVTVPVLTTKEIKLTAAAKYGFYKPSNSEITISPATLTVKGDPKTLKNLKELEITTLNEKNIKEDSVLTVDVSLPDGVLPVQGQPDKVNVSVKLKNMLRRSMTVKNFDIKNAGNMKYEVITASLPLDLIGDSNTIKGITADNITVTVDLAAYENGGEPVNSGMIYPVAQISFNKVNGTVYELGSYSIQLSVN